MGRPLDITLLIPHHNELAELTGSLRSVRFKGSMVVVVVDDGSVSRHTPDPAWARQMERETGFPVYIVKSEHNQGIEHALNLGLNHILTTLDPKYIARLDCRDVNLPGRLDAQFDYMEDHPWIGLLGSWADVVQDGTRLYTVRMPENHEDIERAMLVNNCFIHPTVMMRTEVVRRLGNYPTGFPAAEDYAYFFRFVREEVTANIPRSLVLISKSPKGISLAKRRAQLTSRWRIILENFKFSREAVWGLVKTGFLLLVPGWVVEKVKMIYDRFTHH